MKSFSIALCSLFIVSLLQACNATAPAEISVPESRSSNPKPTNLPSLISPQQSSVEKSSTSNIPSVSSQNFEATPTGIVQLVSSNHAETAKQDLAQRLGIAPDEIKVIAVIDQEYSTDAFYCRTTKERIGKEESPQVISGQTILLGTSGYRYEYHANDQEVIFCRPLS
jgi:hypothetical protein